MGSLCDCPSGLDHVSPNVDHLELTKTVVFGFFALSALRAQLHSNSLVNHLSCLKEPLTWTGLFSVPLRCLLARVKGSELELAIVLRTELEVTRGRSLDDSKTPVPVLMRGSLKSVFHY